MSKKKYYKEFKKEEEEIKLKKNTKTFKKISIVFIIIFAIGLVSKQLQNDTFYTIKIGELIFKNGIDMLDHFSWHVNLPYTYPHWLYDCFIYLIYSWFGYWGLYISSILLLFILILLIFRINVKITKNYLVSSFATFICALSIGGFATARAQLVSFILFAAEIYFIECFLANGGRKNLIGLLFISLLLCNVHVAVWPFYYIIFMPYFAEYLFCLLENKFKFNSKFFNFLKKKIVLEKNDRIKYLFGIMLLSLLTGLLTPIGDTPYTYLIKTMLGNSQKYIQEHQMISWFESPFTIIIAGETLFLSIFSKIKLRDLFMILGLSVMSIFSIRHISLLALIGTVCFARVFTMFLENYNFNIDDKIMTFVSKKMVCIGFFLVAIVFSTGMLIYQSKKEFVEEEMYPIGAVKYIKENIDISKMRIYNDYNFGSYLVLNDIPVFIDSRADLYTKQFSGLEYDIFDDYMYMASDFRDKFNFYGITHVLIYKKDNAIYDAIISDGAYKLLYDDDYFALFHKIGDSINLVIE